MCIHKRDTRPVVRNLYHYGIASDGGRVSIDTTRAFCNVECMRAYNA